MDRYKVLEGVFDGSEKVRIIKCVTQDFGEAAGGKLDDSVSVRNHEVQGGSWGYGGQNLTTDVGLKIKSGTD
ncbi:MAG: 4-oxalocrotonate tautomerase [Boseongicola sp.]|nr:MAG: 4-oxalocrotonate tautomerase [Boseongicola sp.]